MNAIDYAKKRGLKGDNAKVFSALFNQHPRLKEQKHLLYCIRNDEHDMYVQEWIERCRGNMRRAIRVGDKEVHRIMKKTLGTKKFNKLLKQAYDRL